MIRAGTFPVPVKLGPRTSAWRSSDVAAWMASLSAVE
ncbi:AlpA family phage regulatory protein [Cupriavidus basilensis]|nr:AlpA family phage regulatory protein [Cupriavidus basilensis]